MYAHKIRLGKYNMQNMTTEIMDLPSYCHADKITHNKNAPTLLLGLYDLVYIEVCDLIHKFDSSWKCLISNTHPSDGLQGCVLSAKEATDI